MFDEDPDLFRKMDGKMVFDDLIPVFKDCHSWKSLVASEMSKAKPEEKKTLSMAIRSISETLKKANDCTDKDSLEATLAEIGHEVFNR